MNEIKIKKKTLFLICAIFVLIVLGFLSSALLSVNYESEPSNALKYSGDYQEVTLKFINYEYVLEPSVLKKGVPVRMTVDLSTVSGCMRDIVISSFNVRKYVSQGDNVIEFMPDKSGEFIIACSMNMGRGSFSVSDDLTKGTVNQDVNQNVKFSGYNAGVGCH